MTLADMLVVMNGGQVDQIGAPLEVYQKPATTFVGDLHRRAGNEPAEDVRRRAGLLLGNSKISSEGAIVGIRPEDLELTKAGAGSGDAIALPMTVGAVERVGPESFVYGTLDRGDNIIVRIPGAEAPAMGERAVALARRDKLHVFSADGSRRL
jgi:sn-glycerol 3-phosphate transport system ATP-binding protein